MNGVTHVEHNTHVDFSSKATDAMVADDTADGDSATIWAGDRTVVVSGDATGLIDTSCPSPFTPTGNLRLFSNLWTVPLH
jgi:hypothetical protein